MRFIGFGCAPESSSFVCEVKGALHAAEVIGKAVVDFPRTQAAVREARKNASVGDYNPAQAMSTSGQRRLEQMADAYENAALSRHVVNGILTPKITVDAQTLSVGDDRSDMIDSAYHTGQLLAAMACKYAMTRAPADLQTVRMLATGVINLLTLTSRGTVTDPRSGQVLANLDTPVRAYVDADTTQPFANGSEFFEANGKLQGDVFVFDGTLPGASGQRFLIKTSISIDQIDGLLFGLGKTAMVLDQTQAASDLRQQITEAASRFGHRLMQNQGKVLDVNGAPAPLADISNGANPVSVMNRLSWLKNCAMMSGDAEINAAYEDYFSRTAGGPLGDAFGLAADVASPLLSSVREVIEGGIPDFNATLLMLPSEPLFALESDNKKRSYYRALYNDLIAPVVSDYKVPFFDEVNMMTNGVSLTLAARVNGVLAQFRDNPLPPAMVPPTPPNPSDPLFAMLSGGFHDAFPALPDPFYVGGVIYDFGPELSARPNSIERPNRFRQRFNPNLGIDPSSGHTLLQEFTGEDFLLNYWYGRYQGVVSGSQPNGSPAPGAPRPPAAQQKFEIDLGRGCGGKK